MAKNLRNARHKALILSIVTARHRVKLTQRELADKLGRAHSFIDKIESGERNLNVLEFCELAEALGVNPRDLFAEILD